VLGSARDMKTMRSILKRYEDDTVGEVKHADTDENTSSQKRMNTSEPTYYL
jgi:hypothetical protein